MGKRWRGSVEGIQEYAMFRTVGHRSLPFAFPPSSAAGVTHVTRRIYPASTLPTSCFFDLTSTTMATPGPSLLTIPRELRDQIYGYLLHDAQSLETIGPFPTRAVPEARARLSHRRTSKQPAADLLSHPLRNALELLSGTAHRLRQLDVLGILTLQRGLQCHCVVNSCAQA
jgi:hypothetical protein